MIVCPVCGFRNMDANDSCFKCQAMLRRNEATFQEARKTVKKRNYADLLKRQLLSPWDWLIHRPWFQRLTEVPDNVPLRYPFTAGLLSLVPGLGHWYAGLRPLGLIIFAASVLLMALGLLSLRQPWSNWLLLPLLILWLLIAAHAVGLAERANGARWRGRNTLALMFGWMMVLGMIVTIAQFFAIDLFVLWLPLMLGSAWLAWRGYEISRARTGWRGPAIAAAAGTIFTLGALFAPALLSKNLIRLQKISTDVMSPDLRPGDRLLLSGVGIMFRSPAPGDVVNFDTGRFEVWQKQDVYSVRISNYIQRMAAGPQDHLLKRGKEFLRNGVSVPPAQIPFRGEELPDFEITVPEGYVFAPVTGIPSDALAGLMGAGDLRYVGQPGFTFPGFPKSGLVKLTDIRARGIALADPPPRRQWF